MVNSASCSFTNQVPTFPGGKDWTFKMFIDKLNNAFILDNITDDERKLSLLQFKLSGTLSAKFVAFRADSDGSLSYTDAVAALSKLCGGHDLTLARMSGDDLESYIEEFELKSAAINLSNEIEKCKWFCAGLSSSYKLNMAGRSFETYSDARRLARAIAETLSHTNIPNDHFQTEEVFRVAASSYQNPSNSFQNSVQSNQYPNSFSRFPKNNNNQINSNFNLYNQNNQPYHPNVTNQQNFLPMNCPDQTNLPINGMPFTRAGANEQSLFDALGPLYSLLAGSLAVLTAAGNGGMVNESFGTGSRNRLTAAERERLRLNGGCFYCRQLGHVAATCPAKGYNNQAVNASNQPVENGIRNDSSNSTAQQFHLNGEGRQ